MPLDFSQRRLVSAPLRAKGHSNKHMARLQLYAFLTGLMSTLISLVSVVVQVLKH